MSFSNELNKIIIIDSRNLLVFIDSIHFLNDSLDNLVKNSRKNDYHHGSQ